MIFLYTLIINLIIWYIIIGFLVAFMNNEIYKEAKLRGDKIAFLTGFIWPAVIKTTLSGFKDIMVSQIATQAAAKYNRENNNNGFGGLADMMGAATGGMQNMMHNGGNSDNVIDANNTESKSDN